MSKQDFACDVKETIQSVTVRVQKPTARYFDEFLRLKCAPELAQLRLYPNGKELTESFAMFRGIVKMLNAASLAEPWQLIDVGCGKQPRNAALFALRSRWDCIAVDPRLDTCWQDPAHHQLYRLDCRSTTIQQAGIVRDRPTVVVMVHAHVSVPHVLASLKGTAPLFIVSMKCCVPERMDDADYSYYDHGCWSPHRMIRAWDFGLRAIRPPDCSRSNRHAQQDTTTAT